MKKILSVIMVSLNLSSAAFAEDSVLSFKATSVYTSVVSLCATGQFGEVCRVVAEAQDEIAYFVATNGEGRSPQLEQALTKVRQYTSDTTTPDLQLAISLISSGQP